MTPPFTKSKATVVTEADQAEKGENSIPTTLIDAPLKTLFMRNLGKDVTKDEIIDLFGLHKTPFLKKHTRIGIVHGLEHNTAIVEVAEKVYEELLKLSGMKFKGSDILLSPNEDPAQDEVAGSEMEEEVEEEEQVVEFLEIDTRLPEWVYDPINDLEVARALDIEFSDDPTKSVEDIGRYNKSLKGIFRIDSNDYLRYAGQSITIRERELAFIPKYRQVERQSRNYGYRSTRDTSHRPKRKEGTFITVYRAYRNEHRQLHNELFDDYFRSIGIEVIKTTLPQFKKGTRVLNNNRYLVVQKLDEHKELRDKLGSFITVEGQRFYIVYTGLEKYCYECSRKHGYDCPTRARNEFLEKLRKGKTSKRKIYADSIARHANVPALTTDVACMSGGGIGQIINAISYDSKHDEVVVMAGTNEVVHTKDPAEFVFIIDKSMEKLKKLSEEVVTTFVLPCIPLVTPDMKAKATYLEEGVRKIESVKVIALEEIEHDADEIHPTENGTRTMINQLHSHLNEEIIVDGAEEGDITTRKYGKVQALYKVGCRTCDDHSYTPFMCEECKKGKENEASVNRLMELFTIAEEEMFPDIGGSTEKRPLSDDDEDQQRKSARES